MDLVQMMYVSVIPSDVKNMAEAVWRVEKRRIKIGVLAGFASAKKPDNRSFYKWDPEQNRGKNTQGYRWTPRRVNHI